MKILGIDPAPSKNSVIFDGNEFIEKNPFELKGFLEIEKRVDSNYLITWDAPLGDDFKYSLSQKKIEKILNAKDSYMDGIKPPKGISTLPFSGCSHWAISQYTLGYPIIDKTIICEEKLKYHLVSFDNDFSTSKANIIETHPSFSIWVWLKDRLKSNQYFKNSWRYKGNNENNIRFKIIVENIFKLDFIKEYKSIQEKIKNDDYLDAFICYLLGKFFLEKNKKAFIYSDNEGGIMLLPDLTNIIKKDILKC